VAVDGVVRDKATWPAARRHIGFLTETPGLWDRLTIEANLLTYARLHGLDQSACRVRTLLERFGLDDRARERAGTLSKGLRQKVALARALLHDPSVVLLDEPTAGLDPEMTRSVRDLILQLRGRGRAVLLSTHNLDEAERVADRVVVMRRTIVAVDTPDRLRARLGVGRVRVTVEGAAARFAPVAVAAGASDVRADAGTLSCSLGDVSRQTPALVEGLVRSGARISAVVPEDAGLEAVYLALMSESEDRP
jgi:ABC-2 type transport system ATP-binding protein